MPRLLENVNFAKIVTVLAIVFGVALGSCGITAVLAIGGGSINQSVGAAFMVLGYAELAVMILSSGAGGCPRNLDHCKHAGKFQSWKL
jgi:hypothetical protein